jgi:hypothetical protein
MDERVSARPARYGCGVAFRGGIAAVISLALCSCVSPPRMCASQPECGSAAACVAGRCVANGATPAINGARRVLHDPVDSAFIRRGEGPDDSTPAIATLGDSRHPHAMALLRFAVPLPPDATVLEAYILLERAPDVEADPSSIVLHAARIAEPWDGRSVSWATQPRIEETGAPLTRVSASSGSIVRLDVRDLVQSWRARTGGDFGVAVVAEASAAGLPFAMRPGHGQHSGPKLELYIK